MKTQSSRSRWIDVWAVSSIVLSLFAIAIPADMVDFSAVARIFLRTMAAAAGLLVCSFYLFNFLRLLRDATVKPKWPWVVMFLFLPIAPWIYHFRRR